ncbi:MAG: hypothetical protein P4L31_01460 [Candidatus Babeliales bacterium]|nr:hypothetical protein [Candidatus Babeliales bacterium]
MKKIMFSLSLAFLLSSTYCQASQTASSSNVGLKLAVAGGMGAIAAGSTYLYRSYKASALLQEKKRNAMKKFQEPENNVDKLFAAYEYSILDHANADQQKARRNNNIIAGATIIGGACAIAAGIYKQ